MTQVSIFTGATFPDGSVADLRVEQGRVTEIGPGLSATEADVHDVVGLQVLPGLVDLHTHLREPGFEGSETVLSGTRAAAAGGYTSVFPMANTQPVADSASVVEYVLQRGIEAGYASVYPIGAVTRGLDGLELADLGAMAESRARVRVFSDDGKCVADPLIMRRALEYVSAFDGVIAQHAQEPRLTMGSQMNEGVVSARLGLAGWPAVAEESIIARDVLLAEYTRARLHICHVSTAGSVEIIRRAKARGVRVTAEVTPHHLLLTDAFAESFDSRFKVNPPLRSPEDVAALREALADGTIDIVATDHAPHSSELKECAWSEAAFGMVGLETALSIVKLTMVDTGLLDWAGVSRVMSANPSEIAGISDQAGSIRIGAPADLTFIDTSANRKVTIDGFHGKSANSPYLGMELPGRVVHTIRHGYFTQRDGELVEPAEVARLARELGGEG